MSKWLALVVVLCALALSDSWLGSISQLIASGTHALRRNTTPTLAAFLTVNVVGHFRLLNSSTDSVTIFELGV